MNKYFWSLRETGGLEINFEPIVLNDIRNKLVSTYCTVTSNVLTQTNIKSQTMYISNLAS